MADKKFQPQSSLFLSFFIILIISFSLFAGNRVSVPLGHPVYAFLDRMETLGIISGLRDGVKPLDRTLVSEYLKTIAQHRQQLTEIDRQNLDNFLLDFRYEINRKQRYQQLPEGSNLYSPFQNFSQLKKDFRRFFQQRQPEEENHLFLWEDSLHNFYIDFIQTLTHDRRNDDLSRTTNMQTYRFRGLLADKLGYAVEVSLAATTGDSLFRLQDPLLKGNWNQTVYGKTFFDRTGGELVYDARYAILRFAQQPVTWGLGESGQLILSDYVEQFPYINLQARWKWGTFSFLHGKLLSEKSADSLAGLPYVPDKWVVAHRFSFTPYRGIDIGFSETAIYGNRYADWSYLVPFNFYRAVEHNLGDRDNETIAIDAEAVIKKGIKIYGTIFLDEFKRKKLFTNWYGNKHAFQLGAILEDPLRIPNFRLRVEYVAIMPWVYTHRFNVNRYVSNLRPLGYWAGPNSEVWYLHLSKDWHRRLKTGVRYQQWKHGENYPNENIGGDILIGHDTLIGNQTEPRETRKFLEGILNTEKRLEFYLKYEIFNDLFLDFSVTTFQNKRLDITKNTTQLHFGFRLDY